MINNCKVTSSTTAEDYKGWRVWKPTDEELANFYTDNKVNFKMFENEYLMVQDRLDCSRNSIYRCQGGKIVRINHAAFKSPSLGAKQKDKDTINPRNAEQKCAFDLLTNDNITIKLITGHWGTGKTFLLVAGAVDALKKGKFEKIVWIRNNVDVKDTKDLGALPGDVNDKLLPFLGPFIDHVGSKAQVLKMIADGKLEVEPLQSLRGRNIENAIIMCSEAENLTREHLQLIIARAAKGSAVWLDADTKQRDKSAFEKSRGIETLIERLKGEELFGFVNLVKGERSATASLADKLNN